MERSRSMDWANHSWYPDLFDLGLFLDCDVFRYAVDCEKKKGTLLILRPLFFSALLHGLFTLGLIYASQDKKNEIARIEFQISERSTSLRKISSETPKTKTLPSRAPVEDQKTYQEKSQIEDSAQNSEASGSPETENSTLHQAYYEKIRQRVSTRKAYPRIARMQGLQGQVLISFLLSKDGLVMDNKVEMSSGHEILDRSALEAVQMAQPFPAFPESFPNKVIRVEITLVYSLKDGPQ